MRGSARIGCGRGGGRLYAISAWIIAAAAAAVRRQQPGALDDGAIFAREDQGRLHAWARGQVGQQGRDMLRNLLRRRKSAITTHDIVLLNESHRLTAVWAILLAGRVEAGQRRRANTSCSQLSSLMAHRRSGSQAEDRQAVL